ncbi:MAG: CpsD/CapB family tyrosine-protein kinase [Terracidiphilus sp.]|jgi:capsular exopolysaccharide synthesis family protein
MSRIYEAIQRADRERKAKLASEDNHIFEPAVIPLIEVTPPAAVEPLPTAAAVPPPSTVEPPAATEAVLLGFIEHQWRPLISSLPTLADRGVGVEQFRSLRSRVYQARYENPLKTILVSSGMPSEGKSFVAANLAMCLARNSVNNILLIDGDLRRPTLHTLLGAPNTPGLSEYLSGTSELSAIMQRDSSERPAESATVGSTRNLTFIPAGKCGDNSSELVTNHRIDELITTVSPHFDWIVIDSPPVLAVTDAVELARAADAVLLVAREAKTPYDAAQRTQAAFTGSRILGYVLNDVKDAPRRGSYSYYGYYGATEPATPAKSVKAKAK